MSTIFLSRMFGKIRDRGFVSKTVCYQVSRLLREAVSKAVVAKQHENVKSSTYDVMYYKYTSQPYIILLDLFVGHRSLVLPMLRNRINRYLNQDDQVEADPAEDVQVHEPDVRLDAHPLNRL